MSLALKCDFCKSFFTFKNKTLPPNIITFGRVYDSEEGDVKVNSCYNNAPDIIKKNAYKINRGTYIFIVCNKCVEKITNLIIEEGGNNGENERK